MTAKLPFPATAAPRHERLRVMARCEAYCGITGTSQSILALALTGQTAFFLNLISRQVNADGLANCERALDVLEGLDAAAGLLIHPSRVGARSPDAAAAKEALRSHVEDLAAAIGVRPQLIALAVTHDSTLLRARSGVSDAQYATYRARLDRIALAFGIEPHKGETHGERQEADAGQLAAE